MSAQKVPSITEKAQLQSLPDGPLSRWLAAERGRPDGHQLPHPRTCQVRAGHPFEAATRRGAERLVPDAQRVKADASGGGTISLEG